MLFLFGFAMTVLSLVGERLFVASEDVTCSDDCDYCEAECTSVAHNPMWIAHCLAECGFAIVPDAYNQTTIDSIYHRMFHDWSAQKLDLFEGQPGHLRGRRAEYVLPHTQLSDIDGFNKIIYNPLVTETSLFFMKTELEKYNWEEDEEVLRLLEEPIVFDTLTVIDAPGDEDGGDVDQEFHRDGPFGVKIQVPLIDVGYSNGPVEIIPLRGVCPSVFGVVPRGTAIIYQQNVLHRGTKNDGLVRRPVLDTSYLYLSHHYDDDYIRVNFRREHAIEMAKHQDMFEYYCDQSDNCRDIDILKTYHYAYSRDLAQFWGERDDDDEGELYKEYHEKV